jgi:hypothetical protein
MGMVLALQRDWKRCVTESHQFHQKLRGDLEPASLGATRFGPKLRADL